jgi:hypothetical protein
MTSRLKIQNEVENITGKPDGKPGMGFICTPTMKP